jgi:hypothetical protein
MTHDAKDENTYVTLHDPYPCIINVHSEAPYKILNSEGFFNKTIYSIFFLISSFQSFKLILDQPSQFNHTKKTLTLFNFKLDEVKSRIKRCFLSI